MNGQTYFNLERFVAAQAPVYEAALAELRAGRKRTHWMWFIFPQLAGLGSSSVAELFALGSPNIAWHIFIMPCSDPGL